VVGELGAFSWVRLRLWWERAFWVGLAELVRTALSPDRQGLTGTVG